MSEQRGGDAAMATFVDGRPVFVGGKSFDRPVPTGPGSWVINSRPNRAAEVFDPASGTWSMTAPTLYPHQDHVAVGLLDGSLLVAGGYDDETERLMTMEASPSEPELEPDPDAEPDAQPDSPPRTEPLSSQERSPVITPPAPRSAVVGRLAFSALPKRLKPSRTGVIAVTLRCGSTGSCRDRLTVKRGRATLLRRDVTLATGGTATLRLKIPAAIRRALRTRPVPLTLELTAAKAKRSITLRR
jgi:hypothetical protein